LFESLGAASVVSDRGQYPIVSTSKDLKQFRNNFLSFWKKLLYQCQREIIYDSYFLGTILSWFTVFSQSLVRAFRHTATIAALQIQSSLVSITAQHQKQLGVNDRQLQSERRKTQSSLTKVNGLLEIHPYIIKEKIALILQAGANVILTTKGIDDLCLKYFVEAGAMAVRRCKKEDLKRIAKATGGSVLGSLVDLNGNETFDAANLGSAEEVAQERIADDECILIRTGNRKAASIILRGANGVMLDEMERSLHDALCVIKRTLESNSVVPGGGAVEAALSIYLENFATTLGSREQLAIAEFAEALLVIPKTLAVNAAKDATELVAKLRAHHNAAQTDASKKHLANAGLDLYNGKVRNNLEAGVLEPAVGKVKMIKFATEATITILRIDDLIKLNPKQEEQHDGH